jgi:hypothetical protein
MAGTDEADDNRLTGRLPRAPRSGTDSPDADAEPELDLPDDHEIETVTKLMGFLRSTDDD